MIQIYTLTQGTHIYFVIEHKQGAFRKGCHFQKSPTNIWFDDDNNNTYYSKLRWIDSSITKCNVHITVFSSDVFNIISCKKINSSLTWIKASKQFGSKNAWILTNQMSVIRLMWHEYIYRSWFDKLLLIFIKLPPTAKKAETNAQPL